MSQRTARLRPKHALRCVVLCCAALIIFTGQRASSFSFSAVSPVTCALTAQSRLAAKNPPTSRSAPNGARRLQKGGQLKGQLKVEMGGRHQRHRETAWLCWFGLNWLKLGCGGCGVGVGWLVPKGCRDTGRWKRYQLLTPLHSSGDNRPVAGFMTHHLSSFKKSAAVITAALANLLDAVASTPNPQHRLTNPTPQHRLTNPNPQHATPTD